MMKSVHSGDFKEDLKEDLRVEQVLETVEDIRKFLTHFESKKVDTLLGLEGFAFDVLNLQKNHRAAQDRLQALEGQVEREQSAHREQVIRFEMLQQEKDHRIAEISTQFAHVQKINNDLQDENRSLNQKLHDLTQAWSVDRSHNENKIKMLEEESLKNLKEAQELNERLVKELTLLRKKIKLKLQSALDQALRLSDDSERA